MKKTILYLVVLWISTSGWSQTYFSEKYHYFGIHSADIATDILQVDDGYLVPGRFVLNDSTFFPKIGIKKIDKIGNEVYAKYIGLSDTTFGWHLSLLIEDYNDNPNQSGYYGIGYKSHYIKQLEISEFVGLIIRFDSQPDTLWTATIADNVLPVDTSYMFQHCAVLPNNELIIVGRITRNLTERKTLLIKTDSSGNELWRQHFYFGGINYGINVISAPDHGFVLSAYVTESWPNESYPVIIKTDSLGNEEWRQEFWEYNHEHGPMFISNSIDNTFIGGYLYSDSVDHSDSYNRDAIVKMNYEGDLLWEKRYGFAAYNKENTSLLVSQSGEIIVAGKIYGDFPQRLAYLLKVTSNGDSLWYREYRKWWGINGDNILNCVTQTIDGGYAAAGSVQPTGNKYIWVLKVDSLGCESFDYCWTSLPGVISVEKPGELQVFPNPATGSCTVDIPKENQFETYTLFIYNLLGVKMEEVVVPSGEIQVVLNLSGYAPGLYSVVTSYKGSVTGRGKFVVSGK
ncbi:MAG: T9SS type A sorting domain-containing protein [Bacteroidetes bacterium]|nr:T9SS type A sorting domain-containing protein [Bacteroidota bacterium]